MTSRRFRVRALSATGSRVTHTIAAPDAAAAIRSVSGDGAIVLSIDDEKAAVQKAPSRDDAISALKQLSVMVGAGVDLLEAIETIAHAMRERPIAEPIKAIASALRSGDRLDAAMRVAAPFYPDYVFALVRAGESSGKLGRVLDEAARQMDFERRTARDIQNALTYPAFLVLSGAASVGFLLYFVVPRFAEMLRNARADLTGLSAFVIGAGMYFRDNAALVLVAIALLASGVWALSRSPEGARALSALAHATPGLRLLLIARRRGTWTRIMALTLSAGVNILDATQLAVNALPEGALKREAAGAIPALRAGKPIGEAFRSVGALGEVDASMLRAGERSGALAQMFAAISQRYEDDTRDALKRLTLIVEPMSIAIVASLVGLIVLGLVSALAGIYESIG
jgi:general secretion pathway protein F